MEVYIINTIINGGKKMKHLIKMGLYVVNVVISLAGWLVLFLIISHSTRTEYNMIRVWTNNFGEMWFEFYLIIILLFFVVISFIVLIINEIIIENKKINKVTN